MAANLFKFAPRELSHSAFWAYCLDCLNEAPGDFEGPKRAARAMLKALKFPLTTPVEVRTEFHLSTRARIDILACGSEGKILGIEHKVGAGASEDQLLRYQEEAKRRDGFDWPLPDGVNRPQMPPKLVIISAAFDDVEVGNTGLEEGVNYFGLRQLADWAASGRGAGNTLVDEYADWSSDGVQAREKLQKDAVSGSKHDFIAAMRSYEGQLAFMKNILPECPTSQIYLGTSRGRNWMQFWFDGKIRDIGIFYRLDFGQMGIRGGDWAPVFSARLYGEDEKFGEDGPYLDKAHACFMAALSHADLQTCSWSGPRAANCYEKTIKEILLCDESGAQTQVRDWFLTEFPRVHSAFFQNVKERHPEIL